ncbi:hypothetical protein FOQG_17537 [Fusarium oxysporum f. sp. raphani 54005]|uniref:Uncharacterized protein n=2 Tax=Fusarium oxysporum f. sp. raphani TaxID=96318 RepID=X0BG03_FUSOX|nr:hypothetical protein FOQG_17537 [Fusarium oxysporum f. sp. raphani 54005]KAG7435024.1 hypothetical protein Forpi1262_v005406 [Fusarium oxysporum f. sp. raphani]
MPEPLDLSENDRFYLFGIGCDFDDYTAKVRAAQCFYEVRKVAEAQKAKLALLAPKQFKKNHAIIQGNVTKSLTDAQYSQLLLPLVTQNLTISGLRNFVLGCYTLTPGLTKSLTGCGLAPSFPGLFRDVMGIFSILPDTWEEIILVLKQICGQNNSDLSTALSDAIEALTNPHAISQDSPYEPVTKRVRFDEDVDGGKAGSLQFSRELLDAAINEEMDPNEIPDVEPRKIVMQMTGADANRLEKLLENSPLLDAIKTSRQWRWERMKDLSSRQLRQHTNCIIALISGSQSQDISFVIKVGAWAGWQINEYLEYDGSRNDTLSSS